MSKTDIRHPVMQEQLSTLVSDARGALPIMEEYGSSTARADVGERAERLEQGRALPAAPGAPPGTFCSLPV
ncbi:hypothetical protein [Nonomuraea typhae]|uniref:Uncharacterized protein n=1 Tax=Nonomuraea typhae TaxID=2603600 RepID=A0ABW7ZBI3_9ACTN